MVNLLETLYILTVVAAVGAIVQFARGRRVSGGRLAWIGVLLALSCAVMYWMLGRSAP